MAQEIADSTLLDTWASSGLIVEPDVSKIIEGWQLGEQPPHEYMNWLQNTFGSKLNHILKNGVASWNDETEYLAGSSVQHNGNVWLCKTTNTNSTPTDANSNWKRIITIESLTTVLSGYVALSQFTGANQNLSTSGYQKLPGGLIVQWGLGLESVSSGEKTCYLPIAFPTALVSLTHAVAGTSLSLISTIINQTLSSFDFSIRESTTGNRVGGQAVYFFAVGY